MSAWPGNDPFQVIEPRKRYACLLCGVRVAEMYSVCRPCLISAIREIDIDKDVMDDE